MGVSIIVPYEARIQPDHGIPGLVWSHAVSPPHPTDDGRITLRAQGALPTEPQTMIVRSLAGVSELCLAREDVCHGELSI